MYVLLLQRCCPQDVTKITSPTVFCLVKLLPLRGSISVLGNVLCRVGLASGSTYVAKYIPSDGNTTTHGAKLHSPEYKREVIYSKILRAAMLQ